MKKDNISLKKIPQIGKLLEDPYFKGLEKEYKREEIVLWIRVAISEIKNENIEGIEREEIVELIKKKVERFLEYPYKRVINATGILINTNLGRAPLPEVNNKIIERYSNLEFNVLEGKRWERNFLLDKILSHLTGAEASLITNNNASSVLLLLATFAKGGEVIVSRGELIEIGGSFRLPEIIKESGCKLIEVGTTNKTRIKDYREAINENTKAILKVHQSNFRILGFTEAPSLDELIDLSKEKSIPIFIDQGNGLLFNLEGFNLTEEEPVFDLIKKGADVVTFSGDKLLGGPQAGIAVGKKIYIEKMLKNPLYRALRPGKETFFYLQEILKFWIKRDFKKIPLWRLAKEDLKKLKKRAKKIIKETNLPFKILKGSSQFGGGTTPLYEIPSILLSLENEKNEEIHKYLLNFKIPIISFLKDGLLYLNLRSIFEEEDKILISAFKEIKEKFFK